MSEVINISGEDVMLSSPEISYGKEIKVGEVTGNGYFREEHFSNMVKRYAGWSIYESVLAKFDIVTYSVVEENGTPEPDRFVFEIDPRQIKPNQLHFITDSDGFRKVVLPFSHWKFSCNNKSIEARINQMGIEWYFKLRDEFKQKYMQDLSTFLQEERKNHIVYPEGKDVFRALKLIPFSDVKVVIIGQDPYHNGLASGLSFSSNDEMTTPKSLDNIFTEIENDVYNGLMLDRNPQLERWVSQGVLLLNTCLTVRRGEAHSHSGRGWEKFTDKIIDNLFEVGRPVVWILWGAHASDSYDRAVSKYGRFNEKHLVLRSVHPSPLSAYKGFFGCKHFSKTNSFLRANNLKQIEW